MKSFLEEYGFAILAAIVVILLIAMATPVGNLIKEQVMGMVNKFSGSADKKLDASMGGEFSAMLADKTLMITGPSKTNVYRYVVHGVINGNDVVLGKAGEAFDKDWTSNGAANGNAIRVEGNKTSEDLSAIIAKLDSTKPYYVEVHDEGTGEVFTSNTLTKK